MGRNRKLLEEQLQIKNMIKSSKKVQKVLEEENSKALKRKMEIII